MSERKPSDIAVYKLCDDTIPALIDETGLSEEQWRSVLTQDQNFGLQSKVYIVPQDVRIRALLGKYIKHVEACEGVDFIDDGLEWEAPQLTEAEKELLRQIKDEG